MSKERLEEIKERYKDKPHSHDNIIKQRFNRPFKAVHTDHLNWLIEQAERVQELEREYCKCVDSHTHMEMKNKRYREILKEVLTEYGVRKYGLQELLEDDSE